jgi:hypothetical protein
MVCVRGVGFDCAHPHNPLPLGCIYIHVNIHICVCCASMVLLPRMHKKYAKTHTRTFKYMYIHNIRYVLCCVSMVLLLRCVCVVSVVLLLMLCSSFARE